MVLQICTKFKQGKHTCACVQVEDRIQMANLDPVLFMRACSKQGQSVHSDNMVQQGDVGKFIRRKGGAE